MEPVYGMTESSSNTYRIFVNESEVYSGNFEEVPERFRSELLEALDEWGTVLGKSNLNEMIYSLLAWYEERIYVCSECSREHDEEVDSCDTCGGEEIDMTYRYDRDERLTRLMLCIGMITHVEIN